MTAPPRRRGVPAWSVASRLPAPVLPALQPRLEVARRALRRAWPYLVLGILAAAPAFYLGWNHTGTFNSPDETAAHLAAVQFAQHGSFAIDDALTRLEPPGPTAPRGYVQHDGRAVPIYPLGHLVVAGVAHRLNSTLAPLLLALVPAALFVSLALFVRTLAPATPSYALVALLGLAPLWYWSSRVYMDMGVTYLCIAAGATCVAMALTRTSNGWFFAGSALFALAALMRHSEATLLLVAGLVAVLVLLRARGATRDRAEIVRLLGLYAGAQVAFFVVPMLMLNWYTYGSPLILGYALFYAQEFPERVVESRGPIPAAFGFLRLAFFPTPFDLDVTLSALRYQVLAMVPVVAILAAVGAFMGRRGLWHAFGLPGTALVVVTVAYLLVSRSDPGTFMATASEPDLRASIVRYWMPVYLVLGVLAVTAISRLARDLGVTVTVALVVVGAVPVWLSGAESVPRLHDVVSSRGAHVAAVLTEHTEPEAIVFAEYTADKWSVPVRRTAGMWPGSTIPEPELMTRVADTAAAAQAEVAPVYLLFREGEHLAALDARLREHNLAIQPVAPLQGGVALWRLGPAPLALAAAGPGRFTAAVSLEPPFALEILDDGSATNLLANSTFEQGLHGWAGPDPDVLVRVTSEGPAVAGDAAMRMELPAGRADQVRHTYTLDAASLPERVWSLRVHVLVEDLGAASAVVRVFEKDANGMTVARHQVALEAPTDGYVPLTIEGRTLEEATTALEIQFALTPAAQGGRGVVWWDAVELTPSSGLAAEPCHGGHLGCAWDGEPHESAARRDGRVSTVALRGAGGDRFRLPGPFVAGDRIVVTAEAAYLERAEERRLLRTLTSPPPGGWLGIDIEAERMPRATISSGERPVQDWSRAAPSASAEGVAP